jgi:hypothetical protein
VAWYWERDANAGPYSAETVCVGHASTCDGLVLLLGEELTPITEKEYRAALRAGAPCYVFLKECGSRSTGAEEFIKEVRQHAVTQTFGNLSELGTLVVGAIHHYSIEAIRTDIARKQSIGSTPRGRRR